jgi:hypothetical protein
MVNIWLIRSIQIGKFAFISSAKLGNLGQQDPRKSKDPTAPVRPERKAKLWVLKVHLKGVRIAL